MKYTIKHGLVTWLSLALVGMLLPWYGVMNMVNVNGVQLSCAAATGLCALPDAANILSAAGGYISSISLTVGQWMLVFLTLAALLAPLVMSVVTLFMSIFSNSRKSTVAMVVMQSCCVVLSLAMIILLVVAVNAVNNVSQLNMSVGSYVYFGASVGALISAALLLARFGGKDGTPVTVSPETGVLCVAGEYLGVSIPLTSSTDVLTIGRDAACCNLVLSGSKISRKHCEITYSPVRGNYRVVDTSSNGTYIKGGARLAKDQPTDLMPGTVLYLGNETNSFRLK